MSAKLNRAAKALPKGIGDTLIEEGTYQKVLFMEGVERICGYIREVNMLAK